MALIEPNPACTDRQALAGPSGSVDETTFPFESAATQNLCEMQEMLLNG
jgi:hypothetical protein